MNFLNKKKNIAKVEPEMDLYKKIDNNPKYEPLKKVEFIKKETLDFKEELKSFQPKSFESAGEIADWLVKHKKVLVNMNLLESSNRTRTMDFLCGVMYGLEGTIKKIDKKTYCFSIL